MAYSISTRERVWSRTSTCTSTAPAVVDAVPLPDPATRPSGVSARELLPMGALALALPLIAVMALARGPLVMGPSLSLSKTALGRLGPESAIPASPPRRGLTGRILDDTGTPAAGATIRAMSIATGAVREGHASANGTFAFAEFPAGKLRIVAEDEGSGFVMSEELEFESSRDVVLVLSAVSDLSGVVRDGRGAGIAGATVKVWGNQLGFHRIVTTDEDGRYLLRRVPQGADTLSVWARGYQSVSKRLAPITENSRHDERHESVRLEPGRSIAGVVIDPDGHPVAGAEISACTGDDAESAVSDAAGFFSLPATSAGCTATARHGWFASARPTSIDDHRRLTLQMGAGGAIAGMVVDAAGKPVNSFTVTIQGQTPADGESSATTRIGDSRDELRGTFMLDGLAPGAYTLVASRPEGGTVQSREIVVGRGKVVRGVRLIMPPDEDGVTIDEGESQEGVESADPEPEPAPEPGTEPSSDNSGEMTEPVSDGSESDTPAIEAPPIETPPIEVPTEEVATRGE